MTCCYLPIPGTFAWNGTPTERDWYHPQSAFNAFLHANGVEHLCPTRPFVWSTDLDGIGWWQRWFGRSNTLDWLSAGLNLFDYFDPPLSVLLNRGAETTPFADRNLLSHSHGLQVVLCACAEGMKLRRLVSIAGPVREDMMATARKARPNIERWTHVCSDDSDRIQWLGEIGDGALGIVRKHPLADLNICIPKVGHSLLLDDPKQFHWWPEAGLLDALIS